MENGQFGSKIKSAKKNTENDSRSTRKCFYAKNGSNKQLIFEKSDHFENWQKSIAMQPLKNGEFGSKNKTAKKKIKKTTLEAQ